MTQASIKTIMAAFALGAPMLVCGFAQAGVYGGNHLSAPSLGLADGVTNVDCEWLMDDKGNLYCAGTPAEPQQKAQQKPQQKLRQKPRQKPQQQQQQHASKRR